MEETFNLNLRDMEIVIDLAKRLEEINKIIRGISDKVWEGMPKLYEQTNTKNIKTLKGGNDKKMVMRKIEPGVWKPEKEGDKITGHYISKDEDVGAFHSIAYHLDVEGNPMTVWGSAALNPKMASIKPGDLVEIEYTGTTPSEKGADTKLFDVSVDDGVEAQEPEIPTEKVPSVPTN